MINKALIGAINIEDRKKIEIPEWQAELYIKQNTMQIQKIIAEKFVDDKGRIKEQIDYMIYHAILFLQEKDGSAVFTENDFDLLMGEQSSLMIGIYNKIIKAQKIDPENIKKK